MRHELRDGVFRLCTGLGLLGALWYGAKHPPEAKGHCSPHGRVSAAVGSCISNTLGADATHWGIILVVGTVIGCLVGVLLAQLIPVPQRG